MERYRRVFRLNREWASSRAGRDERFFAQLAEGQSPDFLFIGCSDSRVPANQIMGLEPGDVFVHRNLGNVVVHMDLNAQSAIEYAVRHLHVRHVVVCGHYKCEGVHAAMHPSDDGILNGWLREIRDVYRLHRDELFAIKDPIVRERRLVELNVREQCIHVLKSDAVRSRHEETNCPSVHGWVFDPGTGLLEDLQIPYETMLAEAYG